MTGLDEIKVLGNPDASYFASKAAPRRCHATEEAERIAFLKDVSDIDGATVLGPERLARMAWADFSPATPGQPAI